MKLLFLLLLLQDADLDAARRAERERIAGRPPLTSAERLSHRPAGEFPRDAAEQVDGLKVEVIRVSFPDRPPGVADWKGSVLESVSGYFREQSNGVFDLSPRILPEVSTKTAHAELASWPVGGKREAAALAAFHKAAGGSDATALFVVAGGPGERDSSTWPHSGVLKQGGRQVSYVLVPEEVRGFDVGALAHEIGHVLGLPDKYEEAETSAGDWCLMGTGYRGREGDAQHKPFGLCAVCRARLGWIAVHRVSPRGESRVALDPVERSRAAVRIPLHGDGGESLVLEARRDKGLLIWHAEGKKTPELVGLFPAEGSDRLTPYSEPAFRGRAAGSYPAYITGIRMEEGRVYFRVGPKAELTPLESLRRSRVGKPLGGR